MSLFGILITLIIIGVGLWLINNYLPMDAKIKKILNVVVVVVVVLWLLNVFGVFHALGNAHVGINYHGVVSRLCLGDR